MEQTSYSKLSQRDVDRAETVTHQPVNAYPARSGKDDWLS